MDAFVFLELTIHERFEDGNKFENLSSKQLQNRSFHVVERARTVAKWTKMEIIVQACQTTHANLLQAFILVIEVS